MRLRTQILSLGLFGAVLAASIGAIGLVTQARLSGSLQDILQTGEALQASQEADMMHDAIRGDTVSALAAVLQKRPDGVVESARDLKAHADHFREVLDTLARGPLDTASRSALEQVRPAVDRYLASAGKVVELARTDPAAAEREMAPFGEAFERLERDLAALSKSIAAAARRTGDAADGTVTASRTLMLATLALGVAAALLAALSVSGRILRPMREAVDLSERIADGDLRSRITPSGSDENRRLAEALMRMQDAVSNIVSRVQINAEGVATASAEIAQGSNDLSGRTEQQASALEQTAASMEQLSSTVRQNADNARQGNQLALSASEVASRGGQVVGTVVSTMREIQGASSRIADIIGVIDSIAFQTNILALNAAVEAARAGEQGRGFAVVAAEVRSLAQRSAEAAREIKALIADSVQRVELGNGQVEQAGATMAEVVTAIRRVTDIMGEISAASGEQSAGVSQVGEAITQMDQATQQNAALVEQSAAAAASLKSQADELVQAVAVFKLAHGAPARMPRPAAATAAPRSTATPHAVVALPVRAPARARPAAPALAGHGAARAPRLGNSAPTAKRPLDGQQADAEGDWATF